MAELAAVLLVIGVGFTAFILTRNDGRDDPGSAADSSDLGLPSGPQLPQTVLIAGHESDGNIDLFTVDSATGATLTQLTSAAARDTQAAISPDRRSVIYLSREDVTQLWVVGSDGSGARPLFEEQPLGCNQIRGRAAWNPVDPSMLAVVCLDGEGSFRLQLLTPSGEAIRTLDTGLPSIGGPSFSPDGTSLVYWGNSESDANAGALYRIPTDGGTAPVQLTDPADVGPGESPTWSPDGSRIAFHVVLNADRTDTEVVVMKADGSDPVQLAPSDGIDQDPAWSPDGLLVAFKSDRPDGAGVRDIRLWIMNSDGSGARLVTTDSVLDGFDPAW